MHTPGPWAVKETKDGMTVRENRRRLEIVAPQSGCEMVVVGKHTGLDCLQDDNARLIAAAPELLAALRHVAVWLMSPGTAKSTPEEMYQVAVNAIAKAEGRVG